MKSFTALLTFLSIFFIPLAASQSVNYKTINQQETTHKIIDSLKFLSGNFCLDSAINDLHKAHRLLVEENYNVPSFLELVENLNRRQQMTPENTSYIFPLIRNQTFSGIVA